MYDKFESFRRMEMQRFNFIPVWYHIWVGGQKIQSSNSSAMIMANPIEVNGEQKMEVTIMGSSLEEEIIERIVFDAFISGTDRLQLITIPNETNVVSPAIQMFKMTIGSTIAKKYFSKNEPFCCNLFLINGEIDRISFSFCNPDKLIEFDARI